MTGSTSLEEYAVLWGRVPSDMLDHAPILVDFPGDAPFKGYMPAAVWASSIARVGKFDFAILVRGLDQEWRVPEFDPIRTYRETGSWT